MMDYQKHTVQFQSTIETKKERWLKPLILWNKKSKTVTAGLLFTYTMMVQQKKFIARTSRF